jgi:hypothetical protein
MQRTSKVRCIWRVVLLGLVDGDAAAADGLVGAVVIERGLDTASVLPDLDAEGVGVAIAGPERELVGVAVAVEGGVDGPLVLELAVGFVLIDDQSLVGV